MPGGLQSQEEADGLRAGRGGRTRTWEGSPCGPGPPGRSRHRRKECVPPSRALSSVRPSNCTFLSTCRHFSEFLRSHHFCKYQIEVLTSGTVYLADILFCESALFYFSEVKSDFLSPLSEHPGLTWECRGPLADNSVRGTRRFQTDQLGLSPVVSGLGCSGWPEDLHGVGDEGTRKGSVR